MTELKTKLISLKSNRITKSIREKICKLKMQNCKYTLNDQVKWFEKNIKEKDLHNLLFYKKELIGYNCLRKVEFNFRSKKSFILFDTLVIKKNFRG